MTGKLIWINDSIGELWVLSQIAASDFITLEEKPDEPVLSIELFLSIPTSKSMDESLRSITKGITLAKNHRKKFGKVADEEKPKNCPSCQGGAVVADQQERATPKTNVHQLSDTTREIQKCLLI